MIVRTGAPASFEPSSSIPVRRFTFKVGHGQPEQLLDGPRLATLVKATSSLSVIEVDGIRIVLDGPIGGRPGKQLIVQALEEDSGLKLEVRPLVAPNPEKGSSGASKELRTVPKEASLSDVLTKGPASKEPPSPPASTRQPNVQLPETINPANAAGGALKAISISETVEGSTRTTLLGVSSGQAVPLRAGEELPVQAILARPERTVFSVRGFRVEADAGGFQNGKAYWAEVVSGAPNAVIRIQSKLDADSLRTIAVSQPPSAPSQTLSPEILLPADFPSGTNLLARVIARLPSGEFLLEVGGRQLAAPLPPGIQQGEELLVRIEPSPDGPRIELVDRLRNQSQVPSGRLTLSDSLGLLSRQLKALLARGGESTQLLQLAGKVANLIGEDDAPPDAQRIAGLIEDGGLQYESKLVRILLQNRPQSLLGLLQNDLKALLLRTRNEILQRPEMMEAQSRLAESVDRHLNLVENLQAANLAAQSQGAPLQFEIPFLSGGHLNAVELFIQPDAGDSATPAEQFEKGFKILFLLQMGGLGRTRVDAHLSGHSLSALISVERSPALQLLQSLLPRLEESLEEAGFPSARLGVRLLEKPEPESEEVSSLGDPHQTVPANLNRIDVVA